MLCANNLVSGAVVHPPHRPASIKLSCNLYSFNGPLRDGSMSLEEAFEFCASLGFDAVDPTGYYFPNYPDAPDTEYLYRLKKRAFLLGLDISGTGVRNDFTVPDRARREADVTLVKRWVEAAAQLDAPVLRIFASPSGYERRPGVSGEEVERWVIDGINACVAHGRKHGVMIVLQNHNSYLKTADEVLHLRGLIDSDWFGLNVDIGSLQAGDPYKEIARLAPYAYTWQIKEYVYRNGVEEPTDLNEIARILKASGYRGYTPLEVLPPGDPKEKLPRFLDEFRNALADEGLTGIRR